MRAMSEERDSAREAEPPRMAPASRRSALVEALCVFGSATLCCALLWQLRGLSGFLNQNLQAFIAAIFLYVPTALLLRRKEDFVAYGLTHRPLGRGVLVFLAAGAVVFPLFAVGFYFYYQAVCGWVAPRALLPRQLRSLCRRFVGEVGRARLRLGPDFWEVVAAQFLVVALPEEYFFRGYLQTRLEVVWPSRRTLFGAPVGWALPAAALLFALGHLLVDFNGLRMAVFFPALVFGWMRQATGSILAGVLFHACSNLVSELLHAAFF